MLMGCRFEKLGAQRNQFVIVVPHMGQEYVFIFKQSHQFLALDKLEGLLCCKVRLQVDKLSDQLLWPTLFKALADQVLPAGDEARSVRFYDAHFLEEVVQSENQAYAKCIVCFVHLDNHVAVVLDCGQSHYAVMQEISNSTQFFFVLR